jgi:hypothetical protein
MASILNGSGARMPAFDARISSDQARELADYVRTFDSDWTPQWKDVPHGFDQRWQELEKEWQELRKEFWDSLLSLLGAHVLTVRRFQLCLFPAGPDMDYADFQWNSVRRWAVERLMHTRAGRPVGSQEDIFFQRGTVC